MKLPLATTNNPALVYGILFRAAAVSGLLDPHAAGGVLRRPDVFLLGVGTVHTAERS